jgi:hypothetical protein
MSSSKGKSPRAIDFPIASLTLLEKAPVVSMRVISFRATLSWAYKKSGLARKIGLDRSSLQSKENWFFEQNAAVHQIPADAHTDFQVQRAESIRPTA